MNLRLPPTLRMMYRVHNGQRIPERTPIPTLFYGVFGRYYVGAPCVCEWFASPLPQHCLIQQHFHPGVLIVMRFTTMSCRCT